MDKTPLLHMLKSHFYHTSDSTHPPSARVQKPKFGIIYVLAFHPSSAAIPILLDMGRSPSIPFLAVTCLITHQLPGRLPRGDGQFSEPCSLICKVRVAASKWDRWGGNTKGLQGLPATEGELSRGQAGWECPKNRQQTRLCIRYLFTCSKTRIKI